jgi:hypothetical protein
MRYVAATFFALLMTTARLVPQPAAARATVLFHEDFEDAKLAGRGWYDNTVPLLSTSEAAGNGRSSIEFKFNAGGTKPTTGSPLRRKFKPTDSVYLSYYVKYSANWVGSQKPYHPHEFHFLTTVDGDWSQLSFAHLTLYVEQNGGTPLVAIQDGANVDQARIGRNLTSVTERRAVAGCNGSSDGYPDNCYRADGRYVNEKKWKAASPFFTDAPGPTYKNNWHVVEAFIRLNSVTGGKGVPDGVIQYWLDRGLLFEHRNVLLRTAANAGMQFNQFIMAPYIGDGSPVTQSMWIDDLAVATGRPQ